MTTIETIGWAAMAIVGLRLMWAVCVLVSETLLDWIFDRFGK